MDPFLAEYLQAWPAGEERALCVPGWAHPKNRVAMRRYVRMSRKDVVPEYSHWPVEHYVRLDAPAPDPFLLTCERVAGATFPWTITGHFWLLTRSPAWQVAERLEAMSAEARQREPALSRWLHAACSDLCGQNRTGVVRQALEAGLSGEAYAGRTMKYALRLLVRPELLSALLMVEPRFGPRVHFTALDPNEQMASLDVAFAREMAA